jgi:hypothetical protein
MIIMNIAYASFQNKVLQRAEQITGQRLK